jgi:hypothetical protein
VVKTELTKGLGGVGMEVAMGGMDMEEEVKEAYEVMKRSDVLDICVGRFMLITRDGFDEWEGGLRG